MNPALFQVGPFTIYYYGIFVAMGFLVATALIIRDAKKIGIPPEKVLDCLAVILVGGLIGGRLLFVFINGDYYLRYPLRALMFYEGGLAVQGAIVSAFLSGVIITRIKKVPFWEGSDLVAPYLALAQAFGRVGCFLNGCCYGIVAERFPAVVFPGETVMRVPTQIYSVIMLLCIFLLLKFLKRRPHHAGAVFGVYIIAYSVFRFFMDFFRGDNPELFLGLKLSQWIGIGMMVCGICIYILRQKKGEARTGQVWKK